MNAIMEAAQQFGIAYGLLQMARHSNAKLTAHHAAMAQELYSQAFQGLTNAVATYVEFHVKEAVAAEKMNKDETPADPTPQS